ncbi:MAG: hypothetical protein IAE98_03295 [Candidatus Kapabacteria bacterium]|nr:hypothetical protein [Candidatus Kapabacteria bacterium]
MNRQANASAKSKELQPTAQSQRFAAHLLLPQPHRHTSTDTIRKTVKTVKKSKVTCETEN